MVKSGTQLGKVSIKVARRANTPQRSPHTAELLRRGTARFLCAFSAHLHWTGAFPLITKVDYKIVHGCLECQPNPILSPRLATNLRETNGPPVLRHRSPKAEGGGPGVPATSSILMLSLTFIGQHIGHLWTVGGWRASWGQLPAAGGRPLCAHCAPLDRRSRALLLHQTSFVQGTAHDLTGDRQEWFSTLLSAPCADNGRSKP